MFIINHYHGKKLMFIIYTLEGWRYILEKHGGRLPLRVRAVPEGMIVPVKNGEPSF